MPSGVLQDHHCCSSLVIVLFLLLLFVVPSCLGLALLKEQQRNRLTMSATVDDNDPLRCLDRKVRRSFDHAAHAVSHSYSLSLSGRPGLSLSTRLRK